MKNIIIFIGCLISLNLSAQEASKAEFDGHKWEAPYHLPIPKDWTIERFLIPISFAPQISYKGVEDIRFTPGWGNSKSEEYWTYAFLWFLDGSIKANASIIADHLKAYYTGLVEINRGGFNVPAEKIIPVITSFAETRKAKGDLKTFTGSIKMLDYMQQLPITLNCIVHMKYCAEENKTMIFYELSPQPLSHKNWPALNRLWKEFKCTKNQSITK